MIPRFSAVRHKCPPVLAAFLLLLPVAARGGAESQSGPTATATLTCIKTGNGFGEVDPSASWPPGKEHAVEKGCRQTLAATAAPGSLFAGWSGDLPEGTDAKAAIMTVIMDRDRQIKAEFARELCTLDFKLDGRPENWTLLPRPSRLVFPASDTVLLCAVPGTPNTVPTWTGKTEAVARNLVKVCLAGDMTVTLSGQAGEDAGHADPPQFSLDPQKDPTVNVPLRAGSLAGWFSAPYAQGGPWGAGLSWIAHDRYPGTCPFRWVALNFEHIFSGAPVDKLRNAETPRRDPMILTPVLPDTVRMHWPAEKSSWNMDCDMVYTLTGPDAIDMGFSVTPRKACGPLGYVGLMWASYLNYARDGQIHFWGEEDGREGWCTLGGPLVDGKREVGTVPFKGEAPLDSAPDKLNITEHPSKRFLKPVYYGLTDGDQNFDTQDDTMVVIMMFDREAPIRFALWNWTGNPHSPAWDWQFVLRDPQVGTTYNYRARMIYKPFISPEDVLAEYDRWRVGLPTAS
jgi:hypothetical protein